MFNSPGDSRSRGTCVLINPKTEVENIECSFDQAGRIVCIHGIIRDKKVLICNIYAPNEDDPAFFQTVIKMLDNFPDRDIVILGGDFNLVMNPEIDRYRSACNNEKSHAVVAEIIDKLDLCDIWRVRNPNERKYTWCRDGGRRGKISASRIDMFLVSDGFTDCIQNCGITYGHKSDHSMIFFDINLDTYIRGPGVWKLNNQLLLESEYVSNIRETIKDTVQLFAQQEPDVLWTELKIACALTSKKYAKKRAKIKSEHQQNLIQLHDQLHGDLYRNPTVDSIKSGISQVKNQIESYERDKLESRLFRSKCDWIEHGEKNSKMFFSLEKSKYFQKNMKCVISDCGKHITDQKSILDEQYKFYKGLYTKDPTVNFNLTRSINEPFLDEESKLLCDAELKIEELYDAIMTLRPNKCPGGDGLTAEFYRTFYKELSVPLYRMYLHSYNTGIFPLSTRRGIISLLPKKNKDKRYISNARPLSILNVDNKIIAKAMDNRLRTVLPSIISEDQTGFLKGRSISCNIRKSLDVIEYTRDNKVPAVIMSIDMDKCFDRISHCAALGALRYFNFGEPFIKWVSLFYNQFEVCTQNFGFLSSFFKKGRSVNQGCIISPAIFLLTGEILANKIRNNRDIRGIKIKNVEYLISQFADDMDLYLPFDKHVLNTVCKELSNIEQNTGLKVSYDKTSLYRIGSIADSNAKLYTDRKIAWTNDSICTLGVDLHTTNHNLIRNFDQIIIKLETISEMWYYRSLTLMGKVLVVNTLMSSLFVYRMQVLPPIPSEYLKIIYSTIERFIWNNKRPKLPLAILQKERAQGGLGLVDFSIKHKALISKWIQHYNLNPDIKNLACYFFKTDQNIWEYNLNVKDAKTMLKGNENSNFWKEAYYAWCETSFHTPKDRVGILNESIWYNSNIKIGNSVIVKPTNVPLIKLKDLYIDTNWKTLNELKVEFPEWNCDWLFYRSLKEAIPKKWVHIIKQLTPQEIPIPRIRWECANFSKSIYKKLNWDDQALHASAKNWVNVEGFSMETHELSFKNLYKVTNIVKLRNFQYRLLHNKVFCNNVLYHWKKVDSQQCDFCTHPKQNVSHLLFSCPSVRTIWEELSHYFETLKIDNCEISWHNVLYNLVYPKTQHLVNFIVLLAKFVIFRCKCNGTRPHINLIYNEIELFHKIEHYIAVKNNTTAKHFRKWSPVYYYSDQ